MTSLQRFNPRPRVGGDMIYVRRKSRNYLVSIHAPVWGATADDVMFLPRLQRVSIHAPVWGATIDCPVLGSCWFVSIHAPAWGATS